MALDTEVGLGPGYIVLDWDPAPFPKKGDGAPSKFSAHLYCGQTAGCIKMPLCMQVGLSLGDFVLDGDPASVFFVNDDENDDENDENVLNYSRRD